MSVRIVGLLLLAFTLVGGRAGRRLTYAQASHQAASPGESGNGYHPAIANRIGSSTILLERPNLLPAEAMPLGNGGLGVAVWSADGLTAQLNRSDTLPHRLSPGQVSLPGLAKLTGAKDYRGKLDLYDGSFWESGAGMTATVYVQPSVDMLVVDVTGADPGEVQTAQLKLWPPRTPEVRITGKIGALAEVWTDNQEPGASGLPYGSLAALTADGRDVSVRATDQRTITLSVRPNADGSFRVFVPAPQYYGEYGTRRNVERALKQDDAQAHKLWWHRFWDDAGLISISSPDGAGEYMENLRNIYLFAAAAGSGDKYPGSQAGIADMLSAVRDTHHWDPAAYWHWNLRMMVAANLGAGLPQLNAPYFSLYRINLGNIQDWTQKHMRKRPGICIPETMRFNGAGIEYEISGNGGKPTVGLDCDADSEPYYNARTLSTGAEVSFWIWQQYLQTGDLAFLKANYPLLRAASLFMLASETKGADGLLHTSPSNAHETQWDVTDPTTDIAARKTLYPETIEAAKLLGKDAKLVSQLESSLTRIPDFARTADAASKTLVTAAADEKKQDVITESYLPSAERNNVENIGLEPVWPYGLMGKDSDHEGLATRTYLHRPFPTIEDWSLDPIQAARLGLGNEVSATLIKLTKRYQTFANGLANWGGDSGEFYLEQSAVVATTLQEALVQDYDGVIRIAPAIPAGWDFTGTVFVRGKTKVSVETKSGVAAKIVIKAGDNGTLKLRNPWPGSTVQITGPDGGMITGSANGDIVSFPVTAGVRYQIFNSGEASRENGSDLAAVKREEAVKRLGKRRIGLEAQPGAVSP